MSDPEYVKLTATRNTGVLADPQSGWSITGGNVLPFPSDSDEAKFVRRSIALGGLESATEQDYDDAHPAYPLPVVIFKGTTEPSSVSADTTPFWIDTSDPFNVIVKRYVDDEWVLESETSVDLPSGVYVQSSAPGSPSNGDIWIDTSGAPEAKIRDSGSWVALEIPTGGTELPSGVYVSATEPEDTQPGDFWYDSTTSTPKLLIDSEWVPFILPTNGVTVSDTAPSDPDDGDFWIDTDSNPFIPKRRVDGDWILLANTVEVTQAEYDGLTPDSNTIYVVIG